MGVPLGRGEGALFCRTAEVYAGLSEYTDAQVGPVIRHLEQSGQLDNTIGQGDARDLR